MAKGDVTILSPTKGGPWKPGQSGNPNGRAAGVPNKITRQLKEIIMEALDQASGGDGGVNYLTMQAVLNPQVFIPLVGKVLPLQVTGANGGAIIIERIERVVVDPKNKK